MAGRSFHVVIIGGGIGGLCLAQGLKQAGVSVAVYERDRTRVDRLQGYRIHIDPHGSQALHACLPGPLFDAFAATSGAPSRGFRILTHRFEDLIHIDLTQAASGRLVDPIAQHWSVSRITLRQVLLAGLDDVVHFDRRFARYEDAPDGRVIAHFEDGTAAAGDLLVAADGGNSRVRKQFLPGAERVETGIVGIAGKVPLTDETRGGIPTRLREGPTLVNAPGGRAMFLAVIEHGIKPAAMAGAIGGNDGAAALYPGLLFDNQSDYLFWAFSARCAKYPPEVDLGEADGPALRAVVLKMIAGWHPMFARLVSAADPTTIMTVPIRTSVPVSAWKTRNITLIGDAIHSMTPYRGIGANTALRDAALLCRNLAAFHRGEMTLMNAVRAYESEMRVYGFEAVRTSLKALEQAHAEGTVARTLRTAVFRTVNAVPPLKRLMFLGARPGRRGAVRSATGSR